MARSFRNGGRSLSCRVDYLIKTGDVDWASRLGTALFHFWETREYLIEGRDRIGRLLHWKEPLRVRNFARACYSVPQSWQASKAITPLPTNCSKRA